MKPIKNGDYKNDQELLSAAMTECQRLPQSGTWPKAVHVFDESSIWALKAALAAERPLLVRGEPGCGKSQLARAAAYVLGRIFIPAVVHARSECQDLQYEYDAVRRLGEAQALAGREGSAVVDATLNPERFLGPGPLWWAFDWDSADDQARRCVVPLKKPLAPENWTPPKGSVLLIDEIDKADADLPNGLLETLGNGAFPVPHLGLTVGLKNDVPPSGDYNHQ